MHFDHIYPILQAPFNFSPNSLSPVTSAGMCLGIGPFAMGNLLGTTSWKKTDYINNNFFLILTL